ncbi:MAG: glycerol-3-phosphate acyltransferase [Ignavibacteriaceae bacterium]|nr:glycerol-3-phosphate acyltransferase [Ignavibacteriaceae bacterium]
MMEMIYLVSLLLGYTIGSFPTAYIVLKRFKSIDITTAGTGNVGAMNSYEVTNSKGIGIIVFIFDFLKGIVPILLLSILGIKSFSFYAVSLLGCIYAHCYNPWLKLKGGRGLASAAGGTAIIFPFVLVIWGICWLIFYLFKKDITIANVAASSIVLLIIALSLKTAMNYAYPKPESEAVLFLFSLGLFIVILSKHTEPIQTLFNDMKARGGKN